MSLPTILALQESGVNLTLVGKPWIKDLLAGLNLPLVSLESRVLANVCVLAQIPHKRMLLFTNSFSSALMARLSGKEVIGYKTDSRSLLLKKACLKKMHLHEVAYFWELADVANQYWFSLSLPSQIPIKIVLPLLPEVENFVDTLLAERKIAKPFIVLCPFAQGKGARNQPKIWPYWKELSQKLHDHQLVVCPAKNELPLCQTLVPEAKILEGLNLSAYAALLSKAEQVIANDSGPMHLAAAVDTPTLGIFGVTSPKRTHPWGADYIGDADGWPTVDAVLQKILS